MCFFIAFTRARSWRSFAESSLASRRSAAEDAAVVVAGAVVLVAASHGGSIDSTGIAGGPGALWMSSSLDLPLPLAGMSGLAGFCLVLGDLRLLGDRTHDC